MTWSRQLQIYSLSGRLERSGRWRLYDSVPICLNSLQTAIIGLRDPFQFQGCPPFVNFRSDLSFYDGDSSVRRPDSRAASSRGTDAWLWVRDHEAGCNHNGTARIRRWGRREVRPPPPPHAPYVRSEYRRTAPLWSRVSHAQRCPTPSSEAQTNGILHQHHLSVRVPPYTCGRLPLRGEGGADSTKRADRKTSHALSAQQLVALRAACPRISKVR